MNDILTLNEIAAIEAHYPNPEKWADIHALCQTVRALEGALRKANKIVEEAARENMRLQLRLSEVEKEREAPRIDPPAAPDEADKALVDKIIAAAFQRVNPVFPPSQFDIEQRLREQIPLALSTLRQQVAEAERRRLALVIQSLPATAAGAGTFKESALKALEAARDEREGKER